MTLRAAEESARQRLQAALHAEADRRAKLGHYDFAHDLRRHASAVSNAASMLAASRTVRG